MRDEIEEELRALSAQGGRKHRFIAALTVLIIPLGLSIWVDKAEPSTVGAPLFWTVVLVAAFIQLAAFYLDKPTEDLAPTIFLTVRQQRDKLLAISSRLRDSNKETQAITSAFVLGKSWSSIQSHLPIFFSVADADLKEACKRIIDPLTSSLSDIFSMTFNDQWSIAVYA